jgi:5'-3' exonuclease
MSQPLLLADTPHLLYRAFFALPDSITAEDGRPVNALLGSVNQLLWCVERFKPRAVVCCFGQESADYRTELYPPYHAHRPPMPDDLAHQWQLAPALYEALGWTVAAHDALEADDLMHAYAAAEVDAGGRAQILTGDRDMFQCARDGVTILLQRARQEGPEEMGAEEVEQRYGIPPALVPDFIALRGDPSDGLPGAKGIGEKTAAELLRRHGSLEAVIAGAIRERPAVRRALLEQADELRAFKDIATLRDVEVERPADRATDRAGGAAAVAELGMARLAERLQGDERPLRAVSRRPVSTTARPGRDPRPSRCRARDRRVPADRRACRPTNSPSRPTR